MLIGQATRYPLEHQLDERYATIAEPVEQALCADCLVGPCNQLTPCSNGFVDVLRLSRSSVQCESEDHDWITLELRQNIPELGNFAVEMAE